MEVVEVVLEVVILEVVVVVVVVAFVVLVSLHKSLLNRFSLAN